MKKSVSIMLLMSLLFTMFASVGHAASVPPKLFLEGKQLMSDVDPKIENGSTLVPLAILSEGLGYEVEWEPVMKKVTVKNDSTVIELIIGEAMVKVNDVIMDIAAKPQLMNQRTMVPVRAVGELLGLEFEWKAAEREVHMFRIQPEQPEQPEQPAEPNPTEPEQPKPIGYITGVSMDEHSVITITHTDVQKPGKPLVLDNPKRLAFDFKNTTFEPFFNGETRIEVADNPLLTGFRYAQFQLNPLTARLVILIGDDTGYVVSESENTIQIALMPTAEVPAEPEKPADPEPPVTTPPTEGNSDAKYTVVLDAGHGAKDPGAYSKSMSRWEKEFNLNAALKLKAELEKDKRINVLMTRSDDTFLELADRIKFAQDHKADLFISIHANSYDKTSVNGSETYYYRDNSKALADFLHPYVLAGTGLNNRGVKKAAFKVIKETTMPAVLIEAGYLSNDGDAKALFTDSVQNKFAAEVGKGIIAYLKLK